MKDQHTSGVAAAAADLDFTAISTVHMRPLAAAIGYRYSAAGSTVLMRAAAAAASVPRLNQNKWMDQCWWMLELMPKRS
jgi:hypothetical protein